MTRPYLPFIDHMKCLGMALIVLGHVSSATDGAIPPIYPKQLGVAFFVFITGYSLAGEARGTARALFHRLFEVYLFGGACALILSAIAYARHGDLDASNYLPFLLGANVAMDGFPANPTTWYIGTYFHLLLIWAIVLRGRAIDARAIALVAVAEVLTRAVLIEARGPFVAYMAASNWATVFLLGLLAGRDPGADPTRGPVRPAIALALLLLAWPVAVDPLVAERSFPTMRLAAGPRLVGLAATSATVTAAYFVFTWSVYRVALRIPASTVTRFFARNTLIVFIAHMPIFWGIEGLCHRWIPIVAMRHVTRFVVCFVLLSALAELVRRAVRPEVVRDQAWSLLRNHTRARSIGPAEAPVEVATAAHLGVESPSSPSLKSAAIR